MSLEKTMRWMGLAIADGKEHRRMNRRKEKTKGIKWDMVRETRCAWYCLTEVGGERIWVMMASLVEGCCLKI